MRHWITMAVLLISVSVWGQRSMPRAAGRWVVDDADVLSASTEDMLSQLLQQHEDSTSNQVVVLTITSLEGESIEGFANRVFNEWEIGQKGKNNGVLLLVAKNDRKVRIEVGYGLEPYLTDLESKSIIDHEIVPEFKKGDFDQGVTNGVTAILSAIKGTYTPSDKASMNADFVALLIFGGVFLIFFLVAAKTKGPGGYIMAVLMMFGCFSFMHTFGGFLPWLFMGGILSFFGLVRFWSWKRNSWWKSGGSSGRWYGGGGGGFSGGGFSGGGGGFSGGGGSSGGGGASGGW